jgi:hypothetical protein
MGVMTRKDPTLEAMKAEIQSTFRELGAEIKFKVDRDLKKFVAGEPLTLGELKSLPQGAVVWVWYKEHGEARPRISGPMRATKADDEDAWGLDDGSSFGAEFAPSIDSDDSECFDEGGGEGEMRLYHAVLKTPKPKKKAPRKR